jgi:hypothetical protein
MSCAVSCRPHKETGSISLADRSSASRSDLHWPCTITEIRAEWRARNRAESAKRRIAEKERRLVYGAGLMLVEAALQASIGQAVGSGRAQSMAKRSSTTRLSVARRDPKAQVKRLYQWPDQLSDQR